MKKTIALFICIAGILPAALAAEPSSVSVQTNESGVVVFRFSGQTLEIQAPWLSVDSIEYHPEITTTNTVMSWSDPVTNVTELGLIDGGGFATNVVRERIMETVITTDPEHWICNLVLDVPKGHAFNLNGEKFIVKKMIIERAMPIPSAPVDATFGPVAAGLKFSALNENGVLEPKGKVEAAFLSFAAAVLGGNHQ